MGGGPVGRWWWLVDLTHPNQTKTNTAHSTGCLDLRVKLAGKELLLDGGWHDPPHYLTRLAEHKRQQQKQQQQ